MTPGAWYILLGAIALIVWYEWSGSDDSSSSSGGASVSDILAALAKQEGVDPSHNNPGAICGSYTNGVCNGPKTFPTLAQGEAAAEALIQKILDSNPGITLRDFVTYWTSGPGAIGQPQSTAINNYTNGVASSLGMSPDDPIGGGGTNNQESEDDGGDGSYDDSEE